MTKGSFRSAYFVVAFAALSAAPAMAEDEEEKVGIAAGLGLTAATGKTTIAEGGGAVEAALLTSDAVREAGRVIAALATQKTVGRDILVLSRSEQVNLMAAQVVRGRIGTISRALAAVRQGGSAACKKPPKDALKGLSEIEQLLSNMRFDPTDIGAAFATDTTYASVPLTLDDRMLVASVGMSGTSYKLKGSAEWQPAAYQTGGGDSRFIIPSEIVHVGSGNAILKAYEDMLASADQLRHCDTDGAKAAVALADAYAKELITPGEKTGISPLGAAVQADAVVRGAGRSAVPPYVLRVAVEQTGGTAITRGNIWYTLGFPGAATISSGLLTSYRLVDPQTGVAISAGFVRCVIAPVSMRNVHLVVNKEAQDYFTSDRRRGATYCSYIATP